MLARIDRKEAAEMLMDEDKCDKVFFRDRAFSRYSKATDYVWFFSKKSSNGVEFNRTEFYKEVEEEA